MYIPLEGVTLKGFYFTWLRRALSGPPPLAAVFKTLIKKEENILSKLKQIPKFKNEDEEREFWASHDSSEYIGRDEAEPVSFPKLKPSTKTISLKLPEFMLDEHRVIAHKRDVLYQSLIKIFLKERIDLELKRAQQFYWVFHKPNNVTQLIGFDVALCDLSGMIFVVNILQKTVDPITIGARSSVGKMVVTGAYELTPSVYIWIGLNFGLFFMFITAKFNHI